MSGYSKFKDKWKSCQQCELHETRERIVLAKGKLPCDILFVGEAPGRSEDVLGRPFAGPAGRLLDDIISKSWDVDYRLAFTNLVSCIPLDENGDKVKEPHKDHIHACSDRLEEFINLANPELIVLVGKLSEKYAPELFELSVPTVPIIHPAAILRSGIDQKGLLIQRTIIQLVEAEELIVPF